MTTCGVHEDGKRRRKSSKWERRWMVFAGIYIACQLVRDFRRWNKDVTRCLEP